MKLFLFRQCLKSIAIVYDISEQHNNSIAARDKSILYNLILSPCLIFMISFFSNVLKALGVS